MTAYVDVSSKQTKIFRVLRCDACGWLVLRRRAGTNALGEAAVCRKIIREHNEKCPKREST